MRSQGGVRWSGDGAFLRVEICLLCSLLPVLLVGAWRQAVAATGKPAGNALAGIIAALEKNDVVQAQALCRNYRHQAAESAQGLVLCGTASERAGDLRAAAENYHQALVINHRYLPALEAASQLAYREHDSSAVPLLQRVIAVDPDNNTAHAMLAMCAYRDKQYDKAADQFAAAGRVLDGQPDAQLAWAITLVHLERQDEAIVALQRLLKTHPDQASARYDLALLESNGGRFDEALQVLAPLLAVQPRPTKFLRLAAEIYEGENETPKAIAMLREAMTTDPHDVASYMEFALLAFTHGSYDVGIEILNRGLSQLPKDPSLYMARGVLYGQNGDFEKAMADFARVHELDPAYSLTATAEGIAQSQRHDHDAALNNFRRQVVEHPGDALGHYLLAEALSWAPPESGGMLSAQSLHAAISEAQKAIELNGHLLEAYDLLATLQLQDAREADAVKTCRQALALNAHDQQALYSLILALRKSGEKEELKTLVQRLTALRKSDGEESRSKMRYGRMVLEDEVKNH